MLIEVPLIIPDVPIPSVIEELALAGLRRSKSIDCFDFVPSSSSIVFRVLQALPKGTWCEWGSGMGINTGIAAFLGFDAVGIEIDKQLVIASRELLARFALPATILEGSCYEIGATADLYFVYCWPGQISKVEEHFIATAPDSAKLLICHGEEDVRCMVKVLG